MKPGVACLGMMTTDGPPLGAHLVVSSCTPSWAHMSNQLRLYFRAPQCVWLLPSYFCVEGTSPPPPSQSSTLQALILAGLALLDWKNYCFPAEKLSKLSKYCQFATKVRLLLPVWSLTHKMKFPFSFPPSLKLLQAVSHSVLQHVFTSRTSARFLCLLPSPLGGCRFSLSRQTWISLCSAK